MSSDDSMSSRLRAIKHGACDYWIKPFHEFHLKNKLTRLLQKKCVSADKLQKDNGSLEDHNKRRGISDNSELASSMVHRSNSMSEESDDVDESSNPPPAKKPRVVWDKKLNDSFLNAVNILGIDSMICYFYETSSELSFIALIKQALFCIDSFTFS
ncbi:hypothetical protein V8G54_025215 [Vigna mungo]|uniref:Response regulatory domain-containing protein n=1 Tax=Vigna mungo TaxID=3915 RepID=A0AAQ3N7B0_VIGMU